MTIPRFSEREEQVLALILQGKANREIAEVLGIGVDTIKSHVRTAYQKLGVPNRTAAAVAVLQTPELAYIRSIDPIAPPTAPVASSEPARPELQLVEKPSATPETDTAPQRTSSAVSDARVCDRCGQALPARQLLTRFASSVDGRVSFYDIDGVLVHECAR